MKKAKFVLSISSMAIVLSTNILPNTTTFAMPRPDHSSLIEHNNYDISPYYLYLQAIEISVEPNSFESSYTIYVIGTEDLESITGTATLYKQSDTGKYIKKASRKHSLQGPEIFENFSFNSYGPGNYKIIFKGTAYSSSGSQESFSISSTNSY